MIKRPRGRPRKHPITTTDNRKTVADILSENNIPSKNASNQHVSAIVRSLQINGTDLNKNTMVSGNRKRGIIIQSETRQENQDAEESIPDMVEASQSTTTSSIDPIILYKNGISACETSSNQRDIKKRRVRFQLSEDEEDSESTKADDEDRMIARLNLIEEALNMTENDTYIIKSDHDIAKVNDIMNEDNNNNTAKESLNLIQNDINMTEERSHIAKDNKSIVENNINMMETNSNVVEGNSSSVTMDCNVAEHSDIIKDNYNMVENDRHMIENEESVIGKNKNILESKDCEAKHGNVLNEVQSNLYCSVCLSPQSVENFLKHIKEEHRGNDALGWGGFSLPVLLPLVYAVQGENIMDPRKTPRPSIKHPDIVPNPDDPSFFCKACERTYGDRASYRIHLIRVHNMNIIPSGTSTTVIVNPTLFPDPDSPTYYCATCDKDFSHKVSFFTHIKHVHYSGVHCCYNCELCSVPFGTSKLLDRHMLKVHKIKRIEYVDLPTSIDHHTNDSSLDCSLCEEKFNNINDYLKHADFHYLNQTTTIHRKVYSIPNPADNDLFCSACQEYYSQKNTFLKHLRDAHLVEGPGFRNRSYPSRERFGESVGRARNNNHIAPLRKTNANRRPLGRTRKRVKITDLYQPEKSLKEEETSEGTRRQPKRSLHRRVVHPEMMPDIKDKLFYCGSCEIKFSSQNEYYDHLQSQHKYLLKELPPTDSKDDPTYFCSLCHMKLNSRSLFSNHLQNAHHMKLASPATISDFTCELCQEEFQGKAHLSEHLDDEHPHASFNKKKNFICCFCNLECFNASGLGLHKQKSHHISFVYDDVNLYCNLCDRVSPSLEKYQRHLRVHKISLKEEEQEQHGEKHEEKDAKQVKHLLIKKEEDRVARWSTQKLETPDLSDPNNKYCRVCKITYQSPVQYKLHCVKYHKIDL